MKALIVDDESHVRNAIKWLVQWDQFGIDKIYEAENGDDAISIIEQQRPQIVILDMMMPVKSGVELMRWISECGMLIKMIVISGHDDFEFVRSAVKYGGVDYLLKPIDPEAVNEVVQKAVEEYKKDEQTRSKNKLVHQYQYVLAEKLLTQMINDPESHSAALHRLREDCGIIPDSQSMRLALLQPTDEEALIKRFGSSDLLYFSMHNICNEYMKQHGQGIAFRYWGGTEKIVLLLWKNSTRFPELLLNLNDGFRSILRQKMHFGLSSEGRFPTDLPALYDEAEDALDRRNLLNPSLYIHSLDSAHHGPADSDEPSMLFANIVEPWRLAVLSGNEEEIVKAVDDWMSNLKSQTVITPKMLTQWVNETYRFRSKLLREALTNKAEECLSFLQKDDIPLPYETDTVHYQKWQRFWLDFLLRLSRAMLSYQSQRQNIIYEIAKYIEQHYDQDISLQDMSDRFFVSREYISRKFKQQFDINLSDYLGQIRINNAKKLMFNPHLTIAEIAKMVGYQDEKYFSKVFKKHEHMTPNQYRKKSLSTP